MFVVSCHLLKSPHLSLYWIDNGIEWRENSVLMVMSHYCSCAFFFFCFQHLKYNFRLLSQWAYYYCKLGVLSCIDKPWTYWKQKKNNSTQPNRFIKRPTQMSTTLSLLSVILPQLLCDLTHEEKSNFQNHKQELSNFLQLRTSKAYYSYICGCKCIKGVSIRLS